MAAGLKVSKQRIKTPIQGWTPHDDRRIVFYGIEVVRTEKTSAGEMMRVKLALKAELRNPNQDVAVHVGWVEQVELLAPGVRSPELWYWNDHYWLKATVSGKGDWYVNGTYLLYQVEVVEPEGFLERLNQERQQIVNLLGE